MEVINLASDGGEEPSHPAPAAAAPPPASAAAAAAAAADDDDVVILDSPPHGLPPTTAPTAAAAADAEVAAPAAPVPPPPPPAAAAAAARQPSPQPQAEVEAADEPDLYMLDCGCLEASAGELGGAVGDAASTLCAMLAPSDDAGAPDAMLLAAGVACLSCRQCGTLLSTQDACKLLGAAAMSDVFAAVAAAVRAVHHRHGAGAAAALPTPAADAAADASTASHAAACTAVRAALQCWRHLAGMQAVLLAGDKAADCTEGAGGSGSGGGKGARSGTRSAAAAAAAAAAGGAGSSRQAAAPKRQAGKQHSAQAPPYSLYKRYDDEYGDDYYDEEYEDEYDEGGYGYYQQPAYAYGGRGGGKKQQRQPKVVWAAGTGYGGGEGGLDAQARAAMSKAAKRQAGADAAVAAHLAAITRMVTSGGAPEPTAAAGAAEGGSRKRARDAGDAPAPAPAAASSSLHAGGAVGAAPWPLVAVLLGGPLAWLLRLLFQSDLMDVVARRELYNAGMQLLRVISTNLDLLPLLQLPADDPRDTPSAAPPAAPAAGAPAPAAAAAGPPKQLLAELKRLKQQARLYQRSAAEMLTDADGGGGSQGGGGSGEDTTAAVCLALDVSSLVRSLEEAVQLLRLSMPDGWALSLVPLSATAADAAKQQQQQQQQQQQRGRRGRSQAAAAAPAPAAAAAAAAASDAAAHEAAYVAAMTPFRFRETDLGHHTFAREAEAGGGTSGEMMRRRLKRITEELGALATSLPLSPDSSIFVAVHEERLDLLRAMVLPHPDTPYGGGAFLFDIFLPQAYPDVPPKVLHLTTGGGRWRSNPNLYADGKVCLSLLGTWAGPSWQPGVSTLLQVLISLQSMVFVEDPWYNEPGYERHAGSSQAAAYSAGVRLGTAQHAILAALRRPDPVFAEAIAAHFRLQGPAVLAMLRRWVADAQRLPQPQPYQQQQHYQQQLPQYYAAAQQPWNAMMAGLGLPAGWGGGRGRGGQGSGGRGGGRGRGGGAAAAAAPAAPPPQPPPRPYGLPEVVQEVEAELAKLGVSVVAEDPPTGNAAGQQQQQQRQQDGDSSRAAPAAAAAAAAAEGRAAAAAACGADDDDVVITEADWEVAEVAAAAAARRAARQAQQRRQSAPTEVVDLT